MCGGGGGGGEEVVEPGGGDGEGFGAQELSCYLGLGVSHGDEVEIGVV